MKKIKDSKDIRNTKDIRDAKGTKDIRGVIISGIPRVSSIPEILVKQTNQIY